MTKNNLTSRVVRLEERHDQVLSSIDNVNRRFNHEIGDIKDSIKKISDVQRDIWIEMIKGKRDNRWIVGIVGIAITLLYFILPRVFG